MPGPAAPLLAAPPAEGQEARARLLNAALRLFAEQGFAKTSIREIAQAAAVNPASISYYFGDKKGLYAAAYSEPMGGPLADRLRLGEEPQTLAECIEWLVQLFMQPLHQGDQVELCMRLHMREMLDPTGLWQQELETEVKPINQWLVRLLCAELGLAKADDDIYRLALAIPSLGLYYYVGRDVVQAVRPELAATPEGLAQTTARMVDMANDMVEGERRRRRAASGAPSPAAKAVKKKSP